MTNPAPGMLRWLALPLLATAAVAAPPRAGLFYDTVEVEVANVEVVVSDEDGDPVTGLSSADFAIFVDGQPVDITNFLAVEERQTVKQLLEGEIVPLDGEEGEVGADGVEDLRPAETQRLNLVVFIDDYNLSAPSRNQIFENLRGYLSEKLDSRDRIMLVAMDSGIEIAQPFTNDVPAVLATIDELERRLGSHMRFTVEQSGLMRRLQSASLHPNPGGGGDLVNVTALRNFEESMLTAEMLANDVENVSEVRHQRVRATIAALERFTDSLAGMRGRKAILYVSDGLSTRPSDSLAQAWINKYETWVFTQDAGNVRDDVSRINALLGSSRHDLTSLFDDLVERASANGVVFYPIANRPRGFASSISAENAGSIAESGSSPVSGDVLALEQLGLESSLLQLAAGTGGIAFTRTANISGLLERMIGDFETFYSLGYRPLTDDRESHRIEVKVKTPGAKVRHLTSFREKDPHEHLRELSLSALHFGEEDNVFDVRVEAGEPVPGEKGRFELPLLLKIPFQQLLLLPDEAAHSGQLSLVVVVKDEKSGGVSEPQQLEVPIHIPNEQIVQAMMGAAAYPLRLNVEPGRKRIALGIRDELARLDGTLSLEVEVTGAGG